jgi:putative addiction module component (TIGR02574 family)
MTVADILPQLLKLSPDEQRIIADTLWRSLKQQEPVEDAEFKRELDRRAAEARAHPETLIPWEDDPSPIRDLLP